MCIGNLLREMKEHLFLVRDLRPAKAGWAPGKYECNCCHCNMLFIGDKHAVCCAECAYGDDVLEESE